MNMHSECQEVINCVRGREIGRPRRPCERSAAAGRASLLRVASFSHTLTSCLFIIDVFPSVSRPQEGDFCSSGRRAATITPLSSFSFSLAAAVESLHFEFILETSERASQTSEGGALGIFAVVICLSPLVSSATASIVCFTPSPKLNFCRRICKGSCSDSPIILDSHEREA